jgi:hypothetical protein
MACWLLPMTILLLGCPGPEDRKKLEAIASFETFIDRFMNKLGPDLSTGCSLSLLEDGGSPGTVWSITLIDYMIRPLAQPADSWLGDIHFSLVRSGEECSPDKQPVEVYVDFVGDGQRWTPYSSASRLGSTDGKENTGLWKVWEPNSEDWKYLAECVAAISPQRKTGSDGEKVETTSENQKVPK